MNSSGWSDPTSRRARHGAAGGSGGGGRLVAKRFAQVISVMLATLIVVGFGYGWYYYRKLNNNVQRLQINVGANAPVPSGSNSAQKHIDIDGKDQNLLIVGNDDRSDTTPAQLKQLDTTDDGGSLATDTMMIVHVPANGAQATLVSLPRDSYVSVPGYGTHKLNSAYADGYTAEKSAGGTLNQQRAAGANLLIATVEQLTGVTIDHFVEVDLYGFYTISNAIGGVPINLCQAQDDTNSGFVESAGKHTIQGTMALAFVRQRDGLPGGDLGREKRQQYFLTAAFRKIASAGILANPSKLGKLVTAIDGALWVDQNLNLTQLAEQMINLSANNIIGKTIPTGGNISTSDGDALQVDPAQVKAFMAALINSDNSALNSAKTLPPSTVTVDVINASTTNGAAAQSAATLKQDGFTVADYSQPASATASATVIEYSSGQESQAKTLAAYVPGATFVEQSNLKYPTLVLGTDGLAAKYIPASTSTHATAPSTSAPASAPASKALDSGCIN